MDTGDGEEPEYLDLLKSVLKEHHITLDHIVLTHWHEDHVGGVGSIQKSVEKCGSAFIFPSPCPNLLIKTGELWL